MNKLIIYLLLLSSPLLLSAQTAQDTVVNAVTDEPEVTTAVPGEALVYKDRKFSKDFKDNYTGSEFTYEIKPKAKSQLERLLEAIRRFLDNLFSYGDSATGTSGFTIFMRILAVLIFGFVIYMIVRALLNKEGMWIFSRSRKNISVQDINEENIHQMDFKQLTEDTKKTGDYKLAVRYYYLWLLKKLSNNDIIDWHWDKTNRDYLYEIKNSTLKKDFEYLSYVYDYSWYGDFPLDETAFVKAEKAFIKTLNTL
ncbi:hypothetical protein D3C87_404910 [compost metagenome]